MDDDTRRDILVYAKLAVDAAALVGMLVESTQSNNVTDAMRSKIKRKMQAVDDRWASLAPKPDAPGN